MGAALYVIAGFMAAVAYRGAINHYDSPWGVLIVIAAGVAFAGACFDYNFKRD